jgi:hypothetical protein
MRFNLLRLVVTICWARKLRDDSTKMMHFNVSYFGRSTSERQCKGKATPLQA